MLVKVFGYNNEMSVAWPSEKKIWINKKKVEPVLAQKQLIPISTSENRPFHAV